MEVYVLLKNYGEGEDFVGVFSNTENARKFAENTEQGKIYPTLASVPFQEAQISEVGWNKEDGRGYTIDGGWYIILKENVDKRR